ncbi:hypothetical protein LCGC14_2020280 [marine sediment metagenome]|uniref:Uncharacterized protein n=1 Tax=marine sediment metagenome TaxID=412755 RepID=A0A0F9HUV1_9ZZZZ
MRMFNISVDSAVCTLLADLLDLGFAFDETWNGRKFTDHEKKEIQHIIDLFRAPPR